MKRFLSLLILLASFAVPALSEQKVLMFTYGVGTVNQGRTVGLSDAKHQVSTPVEVVTLLKQGWRVVGVTTSSSSYYGYLIIFVLESPAPTVTQPPL
jgi:hypothetical protein